VDISELTPREQTKWREYVSQLLAPCSDQPVSVAQCVEQKRPCAACTPSAQFLVERVRRGDARSQVEEAFRQRFSPEAVKSIDLSNSPVEGATSPVVTIVEWADFECPFCGVAAPILKHLVEKYPDQVQLVFKNYPLSVHEHSDAAARAAVAAFHQGKFWQMNQKLFENQKSGLDDETILHLAREVGLDIKKFEVDKASEATADQVARDRKQADELHLEGTPLIYINGRHFVLDLRQDLEPWVQLEIAMNSSAPSAADKGPSSASTKADHPNKAESGKTVGSLSAGSASAGSASAGSASAGSASAGSAKVEASGTPRAKSN
jgi:protein-disulfide isomerase